MSNIELNATAKDLLSIRSMIAELEAEAEALNNKIKQAMRPRSLMSPCPQRIHRHHMTPVAGGVADA